MPSYRNKINRAENHIEAFKDLTRHVPAHRRKSAVRTLEKKARDGRVSDKDLRSAMEDLEGVSAQKKRKFMRKTGVSSSSHYAKFEKQDAANDEQLDRSREREQSQEPTEHAVDPQKRKGLWEHFFGGG